VSSDASATGDRVPTAGRPSHRIGAPVWIGEGRPNSARDSRCSLQSAQGCRLLASAGGERRRVVPAPTHCASRSEAALSLLIRTSEFDRLPDE
jgi:hypothetical protein